MTKAFPGNPYADTPYRASGDTQAVMTALSALVYEQRTANLIAYLDYVTRMGMTGDALTGPYVEILRRLGLNQEATE